MNQSAPSSYFPLRHRIPQAPTLQPPIKRVKCTVPGCGKLFNRKEHLNRHLKSHDPQRQYECPICGRRYARSDVLKRHVEHHSQESNSSRTLAACVLCHERKLKCDDSVPCGSCARNSTECSRLGLGRESSMSMRLDMDNGNRDDTMNGSDQVLTHDITETNQMNEMGTTLPKNDRQQSWFQPVQDSWSLPFPHTGLNASFPSDLNAGGLAQWAVDSGERERVKGAFCVAAPDDNSFLLPATNGPQVERLCSASRHDVDQGDRTTSSLAPQSPASSRTSQEDDATDLHSCLSRESLATKRLIQLYFAEIHPYWPILHAPTFNTANASDVLLGSVIVLASWLEGELDHMKLAPLVFDAVTATLLESNPSFGTDTEPASLHTLQALLLFVVYTTSCLSAEGMLARAVHLTGILISNCRHVGVFNGQHAYHDLGDCPFAFWLAQEQVHRLAFSVLRIDAYLSVLVDYPPSVRYQEICIPLPKSPLLWTAASEDERRRLQWNEPAGREKALLCFIMRDALDVNRRGHLPYHLTEADYHLGLCSLHVRTWEAAREAHTCESDELVTRSPSRDPEQIWRTHLDLWRLSAADDCLLRQNYFSASTSSADHIFCPLSLILWHISALTLHAPLKLLQGQGCCFKCRPGTDMTTRKNKARLRAWIASPNSRTAVWNAAQISRVVAHESTSPYPTTRLLLNPLAIPGVVKSAIVTCTYAYHTRACPACTGSPPIDSVDLFCAKEEDVKLLKWKEQGAGLATWGPGGIPVCECMVMALAVWFRGALAIDKSAEMELMSFLGGLGR